MMESSRTGWEMFVSPFRDYALTAGTLVQTPDVNTWGTPRWGFTTEAIVANLGTRKSIL
jgi:hypothetical protein